MPNCFPPDSSDEDILAIVKQWIDLLVGGEYELALAVTLVPANSTWTTEKLMRRIANYGEDEPWTDEPCAVTRLEEAEGADLIGSWLAEVYRASDESLRGAAVAFNLPLNGAQSDLTAHFDVVPVDGKFALVLSDLRVD